MLKAWQSGPPTALPPKLSRYRRFLRARGEVRRAEQGRPRRLDRRSAFQIYRDLEQKFKVTQQSALPVT